MEAITETLSNSVNFDTRTYGIFSQTNKEY